MSEDLRQSIIGPEAERTARIVRRVRRQRRLQVSLVALSAAVSCFFALTDKGRALRAEFQTAVLDIARAEAAARQQASLPEVEPVTAHTLPTSQVTVRRGIQN